MTRDEVRVNVAGMEVDDAVDAVLDADDTHDRAFVREALEAVAQAGIVRGSAGDEMMADVAMTVSDAKDSRNLALYELHRTRSVTDQLPDVDVIDARMATFETELEAFGDRVDDLHDRLESLTEQTGDPERLHAVAIGAQRLSEDADNLERDAESLHDAIEDFQDWLDDPETRYAELQADLDVVADTLADLDAVADALGDRDAGEDTGETDDAGAEADDAGSDADHDAGTDAEDGGSNADVVDPALAWFDGMLRTRVTGLLLADLRAELRDLRTWTDEVEDEDHPDVADDVTDRIESLAAERERIAGRFEELAEPEWTDRFGERVEAFEADLDELEPPVDWVVVQETLEAHRPTADDDPGATDAGPTTDER